MNMGKVPCKVCGDRPITTALEDGMCIRCAGNPKFVQVVADYKQAKKEGRNLKDETDDPGVRTMIAMYELESGDYEKVEEEEVSYDLPQGFVVPPTFQKLRDAEVVDFEDSFGSLDIEWLEPMPLAEAELTGIDHPELHESIKQNLKGFESHVAFAWMGTGEYYCWDTKRATSHGEYVICVANAGTSDDFAPSLELFFTRQFINNALSNGLAEEEEAAELILSLSGILTDESVQLMTKMNADLRSVPYSYSTEKELIETHIGKAYFQ